MTDNAAGEGNVILVGVDGSVGSKSALSWASRIQKSMGGQIRAVAAWHMPPPIGPVVYPPDWDAETDVRSELEACIEDAFGGRPPTDLELVVLPGRPASVLVNESARATLMVVGRRGHGGFPGLHMGSVSQQCVAHAHCPVLVVHADDADPTEA